MAIPYNETIARTFSVANLRIGETVSTSDDFVQFSDLTFDEAIVVAAILNRNSRTTDYVISNSDGWDFE